MNRKKKKPKSGLFNKAVLFINAIAVLGLLLSYLASVTDPNGAFWPVAFAGLAYPLVLLINGLFIIFWLFRRPVFSLISLVAILGGWKFLTGYVGFRESTAIEVPKSSANFIRVMTYNVHNFKKFTGENDPFTRDQILNIIRKEQPDVICFQEYFTRHKSEYDFTRLIAETLKTDEYFFRPSRDNGYEGIGMAIFSKYPITGEGEINFKDSKGNGVIYADIKQGQTPFRVYNVHLQSINFKPEDYEYLKEITEHPKGVTENIDGDVRSSRRIGSRLKYAFKERSNQVKKVRKHFSKCLTPYVVAGDFNDTPVSYSVNYMTEGHLNGFREKGSGFGITYNGDFPNFQIDYILASDDFNVKNYRIVKKKLSDHYAVRTDLELKKRN